MNKRQWVRAIILLCVIFYGRDWYKIVRELVSNKYSRSHLFSLRKEVKRLYGF